MKNLLQRCLLHVEEEPQCDNGRLGVQWKPAAWKGTIFEFYKTQDFKIVGLAVQIIGCNDLQSEC